MELLILSFILICVIILVNGIRKYNYKKIIISKSDIIYKANKHFQSILKSDEYFNNQKYKNWKNDYLKLSSVILLPYESLNIEDSVKNKLNEIKNIFNNGRDIIDNRNKKFVNNELTLYKKLFDEIEHYSLNQSQREAIVYDEDNNLIIAGAGTGKTSTLVSKAIYLLDSKKCIPEDILILAFTRNAAKEVRERISRKTNIDINVRTFHSFGLNEVIAPALNEKPSLVFDQSDDLKIFINKVFVELLNDSIYLKLIIRYFAFHLKPYREQTTFNDEGDYYSYLKSHSYQTILGESVRSLEEIEIANFLFLKSIDYEYEAIYKYHTASRKYGQYKPDFYLPEYDIYIEHFGINRNGYPPDWFDGDYRKGMKWKRKQHRKNGTTLIETYSYEKHEGNLLSSLKKKLEEHGIELIDKPSQEVIEVLKNKEQKDIPLFVNLVITFLNLLKSNQYTLDDMRGKAKGLKDKKRTNAFLDVFEPIFEKYQNHLNESQLIDFSDMIVMATEFIREKKYISPFKYILIDEFQDISIGRYNLIKSLLEQNDEQKLFCVGDDWQSIYRFTGSDLSIIVDFEKHFGFTKINYLDTSYRLTDKISDLSGDFIQKNPRQLKKDIKTIKKDESSLGPIKIKYKWAEAEVETLSKILDEIQSWEENARVFVLGRYNFNIPKSFRDIKKAYPTLDLHFLTAHRAKGMEADYVIIDCLISGKYGFPTEIIDDPILDLVLTTPDEYPNAEERRLFYVAMTRAMNKIYLLTERDKKSKFIIEFEDEESAGESCPKCKSGYKITRHGKHGFFSSCSNYPYCDYSEKTESHRMDDFIFNESNI